MVITPTLCGLFGIDVDAQTKTITVNPHLPANWDHAEIRNLRVGSQTVDITFTQAKSETTVAISNAAPGIKLASADSPSTSTTVRIPRRTVDVVPFFRAPSPGDRTQSSRVLAESYSAHELSLTLEGLAGAHMELPLVLSAPAPKLHAEGAVLEAKPDRNAAGQSNQFPAFTVAFPPGEGWKTITVTVTW